MNLTWKDNWDATRQHFIDWWDHKGLVVSASSAPISRTLRKDYPPYHPPQDIARFYSDPVFRSECEHLRLAQSVFGLDTLPVAETDIGPGSLALYLGSEPGFSRDTVWFNPCLDSIEQELVFDPQNRWWQVTRDTIQACCEKAGEQYLVGCPDLIENVDILAAMRGPENLMMDLLDHPDQVIQREYEINQAWFEVYSRVYQMIRRDDGSSTFGAFRLWGSGKTAKLQCDASAMLSPGMFRQFVSPFLQEQCDWLDHSMYHLDGHQCICHLDALLEIDGLDAIEWTADPVVPPGGNPVWYPMYRRILAGGKSVQIVDLKPTDILPLIDAVGSQGLYLFVNVANQDELEAVEKSLG